MCREELEIRLKFNGAYMERLRGALFGDMAELLAVDEDEVAATDTGMGGASGGVGGPGPAAKPVSLDDTTTRVSPAHSCGRLKRRWQYRRCCSKDATLISSCSAI